MNDKDIRSKLGVALIEGGIERLPYNIATIREEMPVLGTRIDITGFTDNNRILGFEIKGDNDPINNRFYMQTYYYSQVCGYSYLVTTDKVKSVQLPYNWGWIKLANGSFVVERPSYGNWYVNPRVMLDLCWIPEIKQALKNKGVSGYSGLNKRELILLAARYMDDKEISELVCRYASEKRT